MALLTRACVLGSIGCCALLASCEGSASLGHADVWLSNSQEQAAEHFAVQAYFEPSVSRYAPHGLYAYVELPRADGTLGVLELDLPTDAPSDRPLADYQASYRELSHERLRFESRSVRGQLVLPRALTSDDAVSCGCEEGVFALMFTDDDDHGRSLALGHLSRSERMCQAGLPIPGEEGLHLSIKSCTPEPEPEPEPTIPVSSSPHAHDARYTTVDSYSTVETGCGDSRYEDEPSSGCSGSNPSQEMSSAGCSDDTEADDEHSSSQGGCEGDTSDQPSSCAVARGQRRGGSPFTATGLPVALVCLWHLLRSARMRKRRTPPQPSAALVLH